MKPKDDIPVALVKELLRVDDAGNLFWLKDVAKNVKAGSQAGQISSLGYRTVTIQGKAYKAHRLVWVLAYGVWPEGMLDHIDGDKANNTPANLRTATAVTNGQNRKLTKGKTSLAGAYLNKTGWWHSRIRVNKKVIHLGRFRSQEEAHAAYIAAKREHHTHHVEKNYAI